ncbi:hypothetical protein CRG98_025516 [Punica granatum]|uniref:Reverse transcriptase zinc-binding domain-containing protein n=1 Tax=Punica granatum TaxID=22663 RepID=A0A2I0JDU2_PUNGR|nr:hypothetical protein CRG98_025516 [Punica granatum]
MHLRNKALLGGLAIQTADEDSPWARLLRHRFDRRFTTNLWKGSPNSFALRAGLEVWELGRKWRIGDGSLVNFWDDTWVGTSPLKKILSGPLPQGEQEMKVSTIISNTREWDLNNIPTDIPTHITNKIKDGSSIGNLGQAAAGGIIRDSEGCWIGGFSMNLGHITSMSSISSYNLRYLAVTLGSICLVGRRCFFPAPAVQEMAPSATAVHLGRPLPCRFTAVKSRHLSTPTQPVSRPAPSPASGKWKRDYTSTTNAPPTGAGSSIRGCVRDALPVVRARSSVVHCLASCPNANTAAMQVGVTRKPKLQVELFKALASPLMAAIVALSSLCNPPGNN